MRERQTRFGHCNCSPIAAERTSLVDLSPPAMDFRATRACDRRSSGCRGGGSSISETAFGTSSIRSSASGYDGPRHSLTVRRRGCHRIDLYLLHGTILDLLGGTSV